MFNNNKETKYYIYFVNREYSKSFNSFEELMYYVIETGSSYNHLNKPTNSFLEDINMNFNDVYTLSYWNGERYTTIRRTREYLIYDENYRTIDLRNFEDLIFSAEYRSYLLNKYRKNISYRYNNYGYKKRKNFWKSRYKNKIFIINEKKQYLSSPKEERKYCRAKRKVQFSYTDYEYAYSRNLEHSWKRQYKCRKQWQKHIK